MSVKGVFGIHRLKVQYVGPPHVIQGKSHSGKENISIIIGDGKVS